MRPWMSPDEAVGVGVGGIAVRERQIQSAKHCGRIAVPYPNPPQPQGATPLRRGHTAHQRTREGDTQKAISENRGKLRRIADLNPLPPPVPPG